MKRLKLKLKVSSMVEERGGREGRGRGGERQGGRREGKKGGRDEFDKCSSLCVNVHSIWT